MKLLQAVDFYMQYHQANSKKKILLKLVSLFSLALQPNLPVVN
jgi:hypothetical protein